MADTTDEQATVDTGAMRAQRRRAAREPRRVPKTRIRVSTLVLVVVFLGLLFLYGLSSERYGTADDKSTAPARTSSSSSVAPEPVTPAPSTTEQPESTSTSTTDAPTTEPGVPRERGAGGATDEPTTTRSTVTLAPGVEVPVPEVPSVPGTGG